MAKKSAAPKKKAAPKKQDVNKTQEVKKYLARHPAAGPTEIVAALAKRKIEVTPNYVSTVKSKVGKTKKRRAKGGASTVAGGELSTKLADAIGIVKQAGGIEEAEKALQTIRKLEG